MPGGNFVALIDQLTTFKKPAVLTVKIPPANGILQLNTFKK
jgi:hypothetical protein